MDPGRNGVAKRVRTLAAGCLAVLPCAAGCHSPDATNARPAAAVTAVPHDDAPAARWNGADSYTYHVDLASLSRADTAPDAIAFAMTAALRVHPRSVAQSTEFYAELFDVHVEVPHDAGAPDASAPLPADFASDLVAPWGFELQDGAFRALRARPHISPFAFGILNTLAAALQTPGGPPQDGGPWEHAEADASGNYRVRYGAGAERDTLTRAKIAYEPRALSSPSLPFGRFDNTPAVLASQGELRIHAGDLMAMRSHDELEAHLSTSSTVRATTDVSLSLVDHASGAPAPSWDALLASTAAMAPGRPAFQPAVDPYDQKLAANVSFADVLATAEKEDAPPGASANKAAPVPQDEAAAGAKQHTFATLVALLRTRPGTIALATAAIDRRSAARMTLLDALGSTATPESLATLIRYAKSASEPEDVRSKAAFALIRTPRPTSDAADALRALLKDPVLRSYAVVGLGTYSRRLREGGDTDVANRAADEVAALLETTTARPDRVEVLQGIANSGDPRLFARVRPLLDDPDPAIRAAAVDAVRLMPNPEIDALVAARLAPTEKLGVRLEAIDAARVRGPHEPLLSAVRTAALNAPDSDSRLRAVLLLQRWLPEKPEVRSTLEQVASGDLREAVRKAARAALGT